ncbi:hypothetical protein [Celerinatantimonas diazotrophica]|uniref:Uncharacterized protein n=1 Tax=Celerinatantimonas diazotrophica TaxID=412034 RepID=A0A4V2PNF0_9GAMM|nr:hypothetical protein [Celerinatantimonas diazotrophica]TCK46821.1 hypothetical protein EV690_3409 [Celerinatantimonas diazotrophica]CAG9295524.1 hypothetical protein CEDIAZO_00640 [Celerinatantimonas diazotrophica]
MNVNVTLPNMMPLAASPPTEDARRENLHRPQIVPTKSMSANVSGSQVGSERDSSLPMAAANPKNAPAASPNSSSSDHVRIEDKNSEQQQGQHSGQGQSEQDNAQDQRSPFAKVSLEALLSRAKASQNKDRDFYHRAPPGAPSTPEQVKAMQFRNQVIAARYQSSYKLPSQPDLSITI